MANGLTTELEELGVHPALSTGRMSWANFGFGQYLVEARIPRSGEARASTWDELQAANDPGAAVSFLVEVLGSRLERESAAAAAALWRELERLRPDRPHGRADRRRLEAWNTRLWEDVFYLPDWPLNWEEPRIDTADEEALLRPWAPAHWQAAYAEGMELLDNSKENILMLRMLTRWRLAVASQSRDPITRSLANAAFVPRLRTKDDGGPSPGEDQLSTQNGPLVSTMIHGTFGWKGTWWRPSGGFHRYILENYRSDLYSRGARFSWSGAYSDPQRTQAVSDFCDWAGEVAPTGLRSVFAHSYGGEIGARAVTRGADVRELILLSSPATDHVLNAIGGPARIIDIRLRFDPVLALARTRQRLPHHPDVSQVVLRNWFLGHSASHEEGTWTKERIADRAGL
ncbi:MAG TPA: alpha/beta hydrolase [Solirubrobacterales bacterium]|nr:alpha/beta hydrolase [Solirubrobacterales bacterium]